MPTNISTGGDGVVPVWSVMFAGKIAVISASIDGCNHVQMPESEQVRQRIGRWLAGIVSPPSLSAAA